MKKITNNLFTDVFELSLMLHLQLHANNLHTEDKIIIPGDKYLLRVNNKDEKWNKIYECYSTLKKLICSKSTTETL